MSDYAVIVQNDESPWDDIKGDLYHYPRRYRNILTPGCRVIYYKGKMRDKRYAAERLSTDPHYFGVGVVGESIEDPASTKHDRYCEILDYQEFEAPVPHKVDGETLETIPPNRQSNYWRDGVREIDLATYNRILSHAALKAYQPRLPSLNEDLESYQPLEGNKRARYSTYYERHPVYRNQALAIHGYQCMACGFDFAATYGDWGKGYIQIHHNKPVSESGPTRINPETDMSVLCANCHAMVHRRRDRTLTVEELKRKIAASN